MGSLRRSLDPYPAPGAAPTPELLAQQQALAFLEAKSYFLTAWNQAVAYSSAAVRKEDLEAARARARQGAEAAKRKLRRLQGTPK